MKKSMLFVMLAVMVLCLAVPALGHARGYGWHGGWGWWGPAVVGGAALGAALAYPYYGYPYPYYGYPYPYPYPSAYAPPPQTQVYVGPQQQYWYYCKDPQGYYPYVASCPGGWTKVAPTQPPQEGGPVQ